MLSGVERTGRRRFPYYIVRFKLIKIEHMQTSLSRFHTTQYDLNISEEEKTKLLLEGFHTTQYDLNTILKYYVVGDCGFHTTQYDLNASPPITYEHSYNTFPYYIVRFKHCLRALCFSNHTGFHTTQYDLNVLCTVFFCCEKRQFPYYIVRFKRCERRR